VHGDFSSMLVGGVSALLLQALHPGALAGVWDHSTFREDILGRLRRTAAFIAATTYGARADAEQAIDRVRRIHLQVVGTTPDGTPYAASDPALLTYVHVAEVSSFLRAHRRYLDPAISEREQDRYLDEIALVAEKLGARDVPRSRAAVRAYLRDVRPALEYGDRAREVVRIVLSAPGPHPATGGFVRVFLHAGVDLLPRWARGMMGFARTDAVRASLVRPGTHAGARFLRWAVRDGAPDLARERMAGPAA
jgi:uncharacterized protein (DUF2236 family)